MPSCSFYATGDDFGRILDFIFDQLGWALVESASRHDLPLRHFTSRSDLTDAFDLAVTDAYLLLHAPSMGPAIMERSITFKPGYVPGARGRTDAEGWGLIQLYLMAPRKGLIRPSQTGHNSAARSHAWESTAGGRLGPVDAWDWREVERISARLNRKIRSLAVGKDGSRVILPAASAAVSLGASLALNA